MTSPDLRNPTRAVGSAIDMSQGRRNVLLIVVDQWRGDTLKALGHPVVRTPHIDSIAVQGVTFARHYAQAAPCAPGRASLLTGQYMMNHRVVQNTIPLDARHTNLAWQLRDAGYLPALVGYTTTTLDPRVVSHADPGFRVLGDLMPGWAPVGYWGLKMEAYFAWLATSGFPVPDNPWDIWIPQDLAPGEIGPTTKPSQVPSHLSDSVWFTDRALEYLHGQTTRPWFLHLGYYRPHPPFCAPAPYHQMFDAASCPPPVRAASVAEQAQQHPLLAHYLQTIQRRSFFENGEGLAAEMTVPEVQQMRATYYGLMAQVDDQIGRVIDFLKRSGQWDNTLVILTSDHGEQLGDQYLLGKIGYFDPSYHIPMIVRDPRREADASRGKIVDDFTESVDVMPTILDWLDREAPRSCDGHSLLPFVRENKTPDHWRQAVHYEFDFRDLFYSKPESALGLPMDACSLAVSQTKTHKYVHFAALPNLLFDLEADPGQFHNLAGLSSHASVERDCAATMLDWRLRFAERTLTGYAASPNGLVERR